MPADVNPYETPGAAPVSRDAPDVAGIAVGLSFMLATVLILFLGISFHLALGGTL